MYNAAPDGYFAKPRHEQLREDVRSFARSDIAPLIADMDRNGQIQHDLAWQIAKRGWIGVTIGAEFGGMGAGHLAKTIMLEELSAVSAAAGAITQASQLGVAKILHYGTAEQQRRWLPRIAHGDCLPTIAVTEDHSGGNVLDMAATAVRDGDDYVLNGHKTFVGNSHVGDVHGVVVRTGDGSRGLTAFLVESHRPGFAQVPHPDSIALRGFSFGTITFDDCRIPAANVLGAEGDGLKVAYSSSLLYGRPNLTAVALGIHRAVHDLTSEFCRTQHRKGRPLYELPTVKDKLGRIHSLWLTAKLAAYHAAHLLDSGVPCDAELVNAKVVNVENLLQSIDLAMDIHGAPGLAGQRRMDRLWSDAQAMRPPAGTSGIQYLRLAEMTVGAAREPWSAIHHQTTASQGTW
jgi:alkylation response protein AidB-like acyl-CoA dehydrogenase